MSDVDDPTDLQEPLKREAWRWVLHMTSGDATKGDIAALERWRAQSPLHAEAFARASDRWGSFGPAAARVAEQQGTSVGRGSRTITRRALLGGAALASAGGAAFVIARSPLGLWPSVSEWRADYRTATGERRRLTLAGGASVELNTRTSLNVRPSAGGGERIELISGEAAVTTGPRPIEVAAGTGRAEAADARFDIRHDGPSVCVTCLDGTVRVEQGGRSAVLRHAEQVSYAESGLAPTVSIDTALVTGWQDGDLYFRNETLSRVIDEVNRYRPGRIVLMNEALGRRRVTAHLKLDRLGVIITELQGSFGAQVTTLPAGIVLVR
jgi:transmembrane sensor